MVIDTSAILAILLDEPEADTFSDAIEKASTRLISAATLLEATMVLEARKGPDGGRALDLFVYRTGAQIVAFDAPQAETARAAWREFGKGRHPAALNFGDCFAYALAKARQDALLFKGEDFAKTDLELHRAGFGIARPT